MPASILLDARSQTPSLPSVATGDVALSLRSPSLNRAYAETSLHFGFPNSISALKILAPLLREARIFEEIELRISPMLIAINQKPLSIIISCKSKIYSPQQICQKKIDFHFSSLYIEAIFVFL